MLTFRNKNLWGSALVCLASSLLLSIGFTTVGKAQQPVTDLQSHSANPLVATKEPSELSKQLRQLQEKVAQLESVLMQSHQTPTMLGQGKMKMGGMGSGSMSGMGMMGGQMGMMPGMTGMQPTESSTGMNMGGMKKMSMMGAMSGQGKSSMGGMGMGGMGMMGGKGMSMMGKMQGMGQQAMASALPGFPGASHIYHIGSTNFFLDHPQHITLTQEQQTKLNQIKQKALLGQGTFDRWESAAEQELWQLTSADGPDATKIEEKVRETAKIRADKRIAFIRAVGEAANVLTDQQRQKLVGTLPLDHASQDLP